MKNFFSGMMGFALTLIVVTPLMMPMVIRAAESDHCDIVSDVSVIVEGTNQPAVAVTNVSPYWTASIPGATWIWPDDPVQHPVQGETRVFVKSFNVNPSYSAAELMIGADDFYEAYLNGNLVSPIDQGYNFTGATQDEYTVTNALRPGDNTFKVSVTNQARPDGTIQNNPGGLLYKLMINGASCGSASEATTTPSNPPSGSGSSTNTPPVIHMNGEANQHDTVGAAYTDPGATATDAESGTLSVNTSGSVDTMTAGTYTIIYSATDSGGLSGFATRTVTISVHNAPPPPPLDTSTYYLQGSQQAQITATTSSEGVPISSLALVAEVVSGNEATNTSASLNAASVNTNNEAVMLLRAGSNSCQPYLATYIKDGRDPNALVSILKLQAFLNVHEGANLRMTGAYDQETKNAIAAFQEKYMDEVIRPWRISRPTGWTYITTTKKINQLLNSNCADTPMPQLTPFDLQA